MGFTADIPTPTELRQWEDFMVARLSEHVFDQPHLEEAIIHGWMIVLGDEQGRLEHGSLRQMADIAAEVAHRWAYRNDLQP